MGLGKTENVLTFFSLRFLLFSPAETRSQVSRVAGQCQGGMSNFPMVISAKIESEFMPFNQKNTWEKKVKNGALV